MNKRSTYRGSEYDLTTYRADDYFYTEALSYPELQMAGVISQYQEQITAAHIDIIFICVSLNSNYNVTRIERHLSAAWNGIREKTKNKYKS